MATNDLMTPAEAAEALKLSLRTLRRYIRSGKLPAYSLGGSRTYRLRRADVERLLVPMSPAMPSEINDFIDRQRHALAGVLAVAVGGTSDR